MAVSATKCVFRAPKIKSTPGTSSEIFAPRFCAMHPVTPITGKKALTEGYYTEAYKRFQELGGTYLLETEGYDLIDEDGKVTESILVL